MFFDEPLLNFDRELCETMVAELGALICDLGLMAIYVTYDQFEVLTLADQVAVMDAGVIVQLASPEDLVERSELPKVAEFLRLGAVLTLRRVDDDWHFGQHRLGLLGGLQARMAHVLVTPRAFGLMDVADAALVGEVMAVHYRDMAYAIIVRLADSAQVKIVQIVSNTRMRIGERIGLKIISDRLRWFPVLKEPPLEEDIPC